MKKLLLLLSLLGLPAAAFAQVSAVPVTISYSGKVVDAAGVPVGNTTPVNRTVTFRIWNHPSLSTAANRLWSESQSATITGGEFSVLVGGGSVVSAEANPAYTNFADVFVNGGNSLYLGVTVDDGTSAADPELSPRQQIVTNPFAFRAKVAESVAAGAIGTAALANGAVGTTAQIATGVVTSDKIVTLDGAKIQAGTLTTGAFTTADLASLRSVAATSITGTLTTGQIGVKEIKGGTGGNLDLATITKDNLAVGSVTTNQIDDGAVGTSDLADVAVTLAKLAANSVDSSKIVDGSIGAADLAANSVTSAKIAAGSVDSTKIAEGSVGFTQLDPGLKEKMSKTRAVYNQGVSATTTTSNVIIPIDLGDLGNDLDGCKMMAYVQSQSDPTLFLVSQLFFILQQDKFVPDDKFPGRIRARVTHMYGSGTTSANFLLNPATVADGALFLQSENAWVQFYHYYPGTKSSAAAPFNANQDPSPSNPIAGGPAVTFNVVSVVTGPEELTIKVDNPHAIQENDYVEIRGMFGQGITAAMDASPKPSTLTVSTNGTTYPQRDGTTGYLNGGLKVTGVPDRMSFKVSLSGATGSYSGGTVKHQPVYNRYRIWAVVIGGISARLIVSDN